MKDTIIKGSGNSRMLASVPNFLTLFPSYEAFGQALIKGELPIDLGPLNAAGLEQRGNDLNKATLLQDATAELLGLDNSAVPNDALMALYAFSKGMAQIRVTVKDASGNPFANIPVTGLSDVLGNTPVFTNENGVAVGYSMSGSRTFSTANILDITSVSKSVSVSAGNLYSVELVAARRNFALFESSVANLYITDSVDTVDVSAVSGGQNGGDRASDYSASGAGGNSGTSAIGYNINVSDGFFALTVGGSNGGTSSFLGVDAKVSTFGGGAPLLTDGNGNSGTPVDYDYFTSFSETSKCCGNGGSGGKSSHMTVSYSEGYGSAPFGGSGGVASVQYADRIPGNPGKGPGGAGGGSGCHSNSGARGGGGGHKGVVSVRIHFKEGITI